MRLFVSIKHPEMSSASEKIWVVVPLRNLWGRVLFRFKNEAKGQKAEKARLWGGMWDGEGYDDDDEEEEDEFARRLWIKTHQLWPKNNLCAFDDLNMLHESTHIFCHKSWYAITFYNLGLSPFPEVVTTWIFTFFVGDP